MKIMKHPKFLGIGVMAFVVLFVALALPAFAWEWTSSNKLVFDFDYFVEGSALGGNEITEAEYINPRGREANAIWLSYDSTRNIFFDREEWQRNDVMSWKWNLNSNPPGTIQYRSIDGDVVNAFAHTTNRLQPFGNFSTATLDWEKGVAIEVKAKSIGDDNSDLWPEGYSWGGNYRLGGIGFNFAFGVTDTAATSANLDFCWRTNDPEDPDDDQISIHDASEGRRGYELVSAYYPLGGTPITPPENIYRLHAKMSPLPPPGKQLPRTVLVSAFVNDVPVIKNKTVTSNYMGWGDLAWIGTSFFWDDFDGRIGMRGEEYDWIKMWELDSIVDTTPPSAPGNLTASNLTAHSFDVVWDASTDAESEVIGYRIYVDGNVRILCDWEDLGHSFNSLAGTAGEVSYNHPIAPDTTYQIEVTAVDFYGNESAPATLNVTTPSEYTGNEIRFEFADNGTLETTPLSIPNYWHSVADGPVAGRDYWLGRRSTLAGAQSDGSVYWEPNYTYRTKFDTANGGSMTLQTVSLEEDGISTRNGRAFVRSSDFGNWFRWVKDGNIVQGVSAEFDIDIVGDANGWCAAWSDFPAIGSCPWVSDTGHQGSDWGTQWGNRGVAYLNVSSNMNLGGSEYQPEGCYVWVDPGAVGEWLQWNDVNVPSGNYKLQARVASTKQAGTKWFHIYIDGNYAGQINLPNTGDDHVWATVDGPTVNVAGGLKKIKSEFVTDRYNLSWIQLVPVAGGNPIRLRAIDFDECNELTPGRKCQGECPPSPVNPDVDICYSYGGSQSHSGNGAHLFVMAQTGEIRNPLDDRIRISSGAATDLLTLSFADGLGWGLTAEDGTSAGCKDEFGNPYPRDGVIQGNCNNIKIKMAVSSAGGNDEYWDIWITRPSGETFLISPAVCNYESGNQAANFGVDGHTLKLSSSNEMSGNRIELGARDHGNIFGTKYNSVVLRNDWDGDVTVTVKNLSQLHRLGMGSHVVFTSEGGEKIVTLDETSVDLSPPFMFYIEQEDRSAGIRVVVPDWTAAQKGQQVANLRGILKKDSNGNPYIDTTDGFLDLDAATKTIEPVGMNNLTVGGSGVPGGVGTTNVGILATVWGKVSGSGIDYMTGNVYFELDDGSGTKVKVQDFIYDGTVVAVNDGEYWTVTGPIMLENDGGVLRRAILADSARKIR